jgi:hypothetical protein
MEFGDVRPTPSDLAAGEADCREIDDALTALGQLRQKDLSALNAELMQAHLEPLPPLEIPNGPACGETTSSQ